MCAGFINRKKGWHSSYKSLWRYLPLSAVFSLHGFIIDLLCDSSHLGNSSLNICVFLVKLCATHCSPPLLGPDSLSIIAVRKWWNLRHAVCNSCFFPHVAKVALPVSGSDTKHTRVLEHINTHIHEPEVQKHTRAAALAVNWMCFHMLNQNSFIFHHLLKLVLVHKI